jgi:hypothetical protein
MLPSYHSKYAGSVCGKISWQIMTIAWKKHSNCEHSNHPRRVRSGEEERRSTRQGGKKVQTQKDVHVVFSPYHTRSSAQAFSLCTLAVLLPSTTKNTIPTHKIAIPRQDFSLLDLTLRQNKKNLASGLRLPSEGFQNYSSCKIC